MAKSGKSSGKGGASSKPSSSNQDIKAASMSSDSAKVTNDSPNASHIGEGDMIVGISGDDRGMKYSVEVRGAKIEGVSEKQISYAEDIRRKNINTAIRNYESRRTTMEGRLGNKYVETINSEISKHGMKSYSEFIAHALASDKNRIGELLKLKNAREIIDKYR